MASLQESSDRLRRDRDTGMVHSMARVARNLDDLRAIVRRLTDKKVQVRFVKENLTFTGYDREMGLYPVSMAHSWIF
jgi:DNA invertase Pin-like site-specific DNA recombinase